MSKKITFLALLCLITISTAYSFNNNLSSNEKNRVSISDITTDPVITLSGANPQTIEVGSAYTELGATANDAEDGDISGDIVIDASAVNTSVLGSYSVTYNVEDSDTNSAVEVTRTVNVVDTTVPVISLSGANPQVIEVGSAYTELGATATDNYDGDISGDIVVDATAVNTSVLGSYSVTYNVDDANSNSAVEVTRTVNVVDTTVPVISLSGANPQVIEVGSAYTELGATATDNYDGDISGDIVVDATAVNTSVLGSYSVTYNVDDANSNSAVEVTRTVNVVDTTVPVISLSGANPQVIEVGSAYTELGATATDNYDGDISGDIVVDATAVNTSVLGSYSVTYNVDDANSNSAVEVTRTVNVVDTTVPVISLSGANPQVIEVGSAYTELGATATDNYDGDISGDIVVDATAVNTSVLGSYSVTYNVDDANSNSAVEVTRTVNVVDTTVPVISLSGANPQVIEVGSAYTELGATATDNYDGDISGDIVVDATAVNTSVLGSYSVTYNVDDANSNSAVEVTRTVNVVDTTVPVISLSGANPQVIEVGSAYTELGATATDNYDGDISGDIVVDATAVNTSVLGSYSVTYNVDDANSNSAVEVTRTVNVVDTTVPVISLSGANPQVIEVGSAYTELGATATDNYDGDISGDIVVDATAVNTSVLGSYSVTYNVDDANSNSAVEVTRTVNVVDTTVPVISLSGANPQVIEVGSAYTELGATATDNYDGDISGDIVVDATAVNTSVLGSYSVTYNVDDANSNSAVEVTRTVNVVDTTVPVISLSGANPQVIEVGSAYTELGATATDNYDGDISGDIVVDATAVNTSVLGSYSVTYNVDDANSNSAVEVTRTVNVVDTTVPVISLSGANPQVIEVGSAYTELGATATDNYDGDISGDIVVDATAVNTSVLGSYSVTYNVDDANSNSAVEVTRTVNVVDTTDPTAITVAGPIEINLNSVNTITIQDVDNGSFDNYVPGGITLSLDKSTFTCTDLGLNTVTLTVTDSSNNSDSATVTVNVVDDVAPTNVALVNPTYVHPTATAYVEQGFTQDEVCLDRFEIISSDLDVNQWGTYTIVYKLIDESGNESDPITRTQVVNNVPTTDAANFTVNQDTENHVFDVLDGDSFGPDGAESFTISGAMSTQNGTLVLNDLGTADPTDDLVTYSPRATYNGPDSFTYTIEDENGDTVTTTVNIVVRPIVPVPVNDAATVEINSTDNIIDVLANDDFGGNEANATHPLTFPNGSKSSASINGGLISIEDNGTANDLTDDVIFYSPAENFTGTDTFNYTITDFNGDASTATVTVTVNPAAPAEGAVDDSVSVAVNSTDNIIDVLDNDNFGTFGVGTMLINSPNHLTGTTTEGGTLTLDDGGTTGINQADDKILYTPPTNFNGIDTFDYTLTVDGNQYQGTVTVTVGTVIPPSTTPTAVDDTATVGYESTNTVIAILSNDSYGTDGLSATHPLTLVNGKQSTASVEGGLISVSDNGTALDRSDDVVLYSAPAGFSGADSFEYTITDLNGDASTATVNITVNPVPPLADPTAEDDTFSVLEDSTNNDLDILDNDSFGSEGLASITLSAGSDGGTLAINENGTVGDPTDDTVTYTPVTGYVGVETFTYTLTDAGTDTDTATVTIAVGTVVPPADTPTAVDDTATVVAGSSDNVIDVLVNDSPGSEGYINNGLRMPNGTLVSASVKGSAISIDTKGTLDTTDDEFNYTPSALATADGTDSFKYTITDTSGDASTGTVTVTVSALPPSADPIATDDDFSVAEDSTNNDLDILDNDSFGSEGAGSITLSVGSDGGTLAINENGTIGDPTDDTVTYTPVGGFVGEETFTYTLEDAGNDTDTATVTVTVGTVIPPATTPTAVDDTATVGYESTNTVIAVLANDSYGTDGLSATHPLTLVNGKQSTASVEGGLISVSDNGTALDRSDDVVLYSAPASFSGADSFEYTITDLNGDASTATVNITVNPVPPLADPTAEDDTFSVLEDSTNNDLDILDNDSFGSEGLASITLSVGSNGGTLAINENGTVGDPTDDTVTYTPVGGFVGVETFTYILEDSGSDTDTATVTIAVGTVVAPADTPTAVDDTATVVAGSTANVIDVLVNDTPGSEGYINNGLRMPNGTLISASIKGSAISIDTKGTPATTDDEFNYTPSALAAADGTDSFDYTITDASGDASTGTVTVTITAVVVPTDEPSAVADTATTVEDTTVSIDVLDNDAYGTDGASTTVAPLTVGATSDEGGALSVLAGEITYTPAAGFVGTDTFEYTITDDTGDTATATVTVTVTAAVFVNGTPTANDDSASVVRFSTVNYISVLGNDDFGTDGPSATHPLTLSNGRSTGVTTGGRTISVHDNGTPNVLTDDTIQYSPGSLTSDSFEYTITDANGDANTGTVFITTTAVKSVTVGSTEVFVDNFMSYPNPSRGNVTTTLLSSVNTKANMMLFDVTGKVVYSSELDLQEGVNKFDFNFKVKAGILYMKIVSVEKDFGTSKIIFK